MKRIAGSYYEGFADGFGRHALFGTIHDIAISTKTGVVYCTDSHHHRVRSLTHNLYDDTWTVATVAGSGAYGDLDGVPDKCQFRHPDSLCFDPRDPNTLYVCCNSGIRIVHLNGYGRGSYYVSTLTPRRPTPTLSDLHPDFLISSPDGSYMIYYPFGGTTEIMCVQTGHTKSLGFARFPKLLPMCWHVSDSEGYITPGLFAKVKDVPQFVKVTGGFPASWFNTTASSVSTGASSKSGTSN